MKSLEGNADLNTTEENDQKSTSSKTDVSGFLGDTGHRSSSPHVCQRFVVEETRGDKCAVTMYPKESCQCGALGTCWHIIAAKLSLYFEHCKGKKFTI